MAALASHAQIFSVTRFAVQRPRLYWLQASWTCWRFPGCAIVSPSAGIVSPLCSWTSLKTVHIM